MDALISPNAFFRREAEDPRLLPPVLFVLATALLGIASQYLVFSTIRSSVSDPNTAGFFDIIMYVSMAVTFVAAFVIWFVYAGVFHLLSMFFDGEGDFATVLKLVGWGYLPSVISSVVTAVTYVVFVGGESVTSPSGLAAAGQSLLTGPVSWALAVVGMLFTLWQGALFVFAVRHGRNLTLKQAAIVVAPLILLSIGASIFTLASSLL